MNPYYDYQKLGWGHTGLDEAGLSYEFNTLAFWKTPNGVFTASDSGCSCPTPFEDYESEDATAIEQKLEQVGSLDQAERIIEAWNKPSYSGDHPCCPRDEVFGLVAVLKTWGLE